MSKAIQRRRGTTAEHAGFTGLVGEVTVDTTKKTAVVHDGMTAGGTPLAKEVHNHDAAYAAKAHESSASAHPEMAASDAEVDAGTGSKWVKVSQLIRATVKTISSILPITLGGTGASTAAQARANLGLGSVATENTVPVAKGGTGAATAADARTNLGLGDAAVKTVAVTPAGAGDSGKLPALDATGKLPVDFVPLPDLTYVPEAGHATTADSATTAWSANTATSATTAASATNADKVDGYHASQAANPNTIPVADAAGKLSGDWLPPMEAATVGGYSPSATPGASKIPVADAAGKLAAGWLPAINADTVDGFHAQKTAALDKIPVAGTGGKLDVAWLPAQETPAASVIPMTDGTGKLAAGFIPDSMRPLTLVPGSTKYCIGADITGTTTSYPSSSPGKGSSDFSCGSMIDQVCWRIEHAGIVTVSFRGRASGAGSGTEKFRVCKNAVSVKEWTGVTTAGLYTTSGVVMTVNVDVVPGDIISIQGAKTGGTLGWGISETKILVGNW